MANVVLLYCRRAISLYSGCGDCGELSALPGQARSNLVLLYKLSDERQKAEATAQQQLPGCVSFLIHLLK